MKLPRACGALAGALATIMLAAASAPAALPLDLAEEPGPLQLTGTTYATPPSGLPSGEAAGASVAGDCDVDGDGRADLIVGAPSADVGGQQETGRVYVAFGSAGRSGTTALASDPATLTIDGDPALGQAGATVACAGDVNGDDADDMLIGVPAGATTGVAYVVFGAPDLLDDGPLSLAALGGHGFRIDPGSADGFIGNELAGVGDLDGDGKDEIAIGDRYPAVNDYHGAIHVVAGKDDTSDVHLDDPGATLLRIDGADQPDELESVASVGDLDGDDVPELLVGAPGHDGPNGADTGAAYVVSGAARGVVDLASWNDPGSGVLFPIWGASPDTLANSDASYTGSDVAAAGDVNDDGIPDLAIAAYASGGQLDPDADQYANVWIVFGKASGGAVDLDALGSGGYAIRGTPFVQTSDGFGSALAPAGDVDGDGRDDLFVGAPGLSGGSGRDAIGAAFLLYGKSDTAQLDAGTLTCEQGARLLGSARVGELGTDVALTHGFGAATAPQLVVGASAFRDSNGNAVRIVPLASVPNACGDDPPPPSVPLDADWGFRESFRRYVTNGFDAAHPAIPIAAANGAFCDANPAPQVGGCDPQLRTLPGDPPPARALRFTPLGASATDGSDATVATQGRVTFSYPGHFFTLRLEDPWFVVVGGQLTVRARVKLDVEPSFQGARSVDVRIPLGTFALNGAPTVTAQYVRWTTTAGTLSDAAAATLGGFLPAGAELDPVTIAIPRSLGGLPDEPTVPAPPVVVPPDDPPADDSPPVGHRAPAARIAAARALLTLRANGRVALATIRCGQARCRLGVPSAVRVRIGRRSWRVAVSAPTTIGAGRSARVALRLPRAAVRALAGRRAKVRVRIVVRSGSARVVRTVAVALTRPRAGGA